MSIPVLSYGFRPFFLAAGFCAVLLVPWWAASFALHVPLGSDWPPSLWHGHEMLFGFIVAAIAGFLLTAVPSWTGQRGFAGWPLALLACLWLVGRLVVATSKLWPFPLVAALDLAFIPALAAFLVPPLLRALNRNSPLLLVLAALWAANGTFYYALAHADESLARHTLVVTVDIVLLLVTVIGGRIVPAFTSSALKHTGITLPAYALPGITPLAIASMVAVTLGDVFVSNTAAAGALALLAAAIQAIRMGAWRTLKTLRLPIVWVLHLSYAWIPVGLALKALALLTGSAFGAFWLHALTIGAVTTMVLAVMTRASLGHTGRALRVSPAIAVAYVLVATATVVRVFGVFWLGLSYAADIVLAATLWSLAFGLFLGIYAPILLGPRIDGKPG